jgi:precorrin-3B C17-methyltransferase
MEALRQADTIIGYEGYFAQIADLTVGKECLTRQLTEEVERAQLALERFRSGQAVCVISSGDPGIYGMASLVLQHLAPAEEENVSIVPGVSAVNAAAALLGAPLGHDFAVISLSDLLTPWELIARRLRAAAEADFVVALLNPKSARRDWQLRSAQEIFASCRLPETPVGIVHNAFREGQAIDRTTLVQMLDCQVNMFSTVIVGNSQTQAFGKLLVTPRGYKSLEAIDR